MARRTRGQDVHGWVALDKPLGLTSTQALAKVRRLFDANKAGHAGTLDPLATGILPIALGEATKCVPFLQDDAKTYEVDIVFGAETTTDDREGEVTATSPLRPDDPAIRAALPGFLGVIDQVPPAFSAIHVAGERAYTRARRGEEVVIPTRQVRIDRLDILARPDAETLRLVVDCGKGTYIRSLARDLARALGTCGHVGALRRTRVGPFGLDCAFGLEKLAALDYKARADQALHPVETALDDIPALAVTEAEGRKLSAGLAILPGEGFTPNADGLGKAIGPNGLIALIRCLDGLARPFRVFNL